MSKIKKALALFFLIFFAFFLYAAPADFLQEYTLENGLKVFLLENNSDALVRVEYICRAGFSAQTQETCGFYKLFTRLVQAANQSLNFADVQCYADSSRYVLKISPAETESTLETLSTAFFQPDFSDELLSHELNTLKAEVQSNANEMSTFINAAIDSRVFSGAPWKHDSGIYPPLFKKTTEKTARNIIKDISDRWYIPKNSALFISGNINSEKLLITIKDTFGRFYSPFNTPAQKSSAPVNSRRKYVLHSKELSKELTQVVVQYTMLNMEQADLMAAVLDNDYSTFKQRLSSYSELNIAGNEYINVSAAHKKDSSRLIIQTLIQPPDDKKNKLSSLQQVQKFLDDVKNVPLTTTDAEFQYAKNQLSHSFNYIDSSPQSFMNNIASFWAIQQYTPTVEYENKSDEKAENEYQSLTAKSMFNHQKLISDVMADDVLKTYQAENPFVFVIISDEDYKKNKKGYAAAGFEEITQKNASWYVQKMFQNMKKENDNQVQYYNGLRDSEDDNNYYQKNIASVKKITLSNGIPVTSKKSDISSGVSMILSIAGGKLNSYDDNGFEDVMINLLSTLIQKEIQKKQIEGIIPASPNIIFKCGLSSGYISIEFEKEDSLAICDAISKALVYGEIAPSDADRAVGSRQYRKRLENGTASNQMLSIAISNLDSKSPFAKVFDTEKDILVDTGYKKIVGSFPQLLDSSRYSVILAGNFDDNIFDALEKSIGQDVLPAIKTRQTADNTAPEAPLYTLAEIPSNKQLTVQIRHTFLTDVPADKAGPMPAVLIPTTEFTDPVIYINKAPKPDKKEYALYCAILNYISSLLHKKYSVSTQFPQYGMDFGTIIVQNAAHTKQLDADYKNAVQQIQKELQSPSSQNILQKIKDEWILSEMEQTIDNSGTAKLMQKGLELGFAADYYLYQYNLIQSAEAEDYLKTMEYFPVKPNYRIYSADSKK